MIHSDQPIDSKSTYSSCRWHSLVWTAWRRWWCSRWRCVITFSNGSCLWVDKTRSRRLRNMPFLWFLFSRESDADVESFPVSDWLLEVLDVSSLKRTKTGWRLVCRSLRLDTCKTIGCLITDIAVTKNLRRLDAGFSKEWTCTACLTRKISQPSLEVLTKCWTSIKRCFSGCSVECESNTW